jgi:hypothetical protein
MPRRQTPIAILNLVQMLDQQVPATRGIAKQGKDILPRLGVDLPSFELGPDSAPASTALIFGGRFRGSRDYRVTHLVG